MRERAAHRQSRAFLLGTPRERTCPMPRKSSAQKSAGSTLAQIEKLAKVIGGIPVWEVFPESAAAMAGGRLRANIASANGTAPPNFQDFLSACPAPTAQ